MPSNPCKTVKTRSTRAIGAVIGASRAHRSKRAARSFCESQVFDARLLHGWSEPRARLDRGNVPQEKMAGLRVSKSGIVRPRSSPPERAYASLDTRRAITSRPWSAYEDWLPSLRCLRSRPWLASKPYSLMRSDSRRESSDGRSRVGLPGAARADLFDFDARPPATNTELEECAERTSSTDVLLAAFSHRFYTTSLFTSANESQHLRCVDGQCFPRTRDWKTHPTLARSRGQLSTDLYECVSGGR